MEPEPLVVEGLVKQYGELTAVNNVSLQAKRGQVLCVLGTNGAGKTTTLEVSQGVRKATQGTVRIFGEDAWGASKATRRRMGFLPQQFTGFPMLTVKENLEYFSAIYEANPDIPALLASLGLEHCANQRFGTLSGGTMRRVAIATALVNDPELLFLDEPAAGVDPASRRHLWGIVESLRSRDRAIVLTTHAMDEAERLADEVVVMHKGRIVARGPPDQVRLEHGGGAMLRLAGVPDPIPEVLASHQGLMRDEDDALMLPLDSAAQGSQIMATLVRAGVPFHEVSIREPSLDDAFVRLVDRDVGEGA